MLFFVCGLVASYTSCMPWGYLPFLYIYRLLIKKNIPRIVRLRLEKIQRDFLWGGGALENKMHVVKWSSVCKAKPKGRLGVCSLSLLNKALLCKWCWRFSSERDSLWKKIIQGKFWEEERGWKSGMVKEPDRVGVWKEIGKQWDFFNTKISFEVGG